MRVSPVSPLDDSAMRVRKMFDAIAHRYDLFNDVLSLGVHRRWRSLTVDVLAPKPGHRYLDVCAGTHDLGAAITTRVPDADVVAADFSWRMLQYGRRKTEVVRPVVADALHLPLPDRSFTGCTIGFGLRNLTDFRAGLAEMHRVLEPGGRLVVLEFTIPPGRIFRTVYHGYFHHVLPRLGAIVSGSASASRYLPDSVAEFPNVKELADLLRNVGFRRTRYRYLTGGIAALHIGIRE